MVDVSGRPVLPDIPLESWEPTRWTLHLWTQIVGKVRLAATPPQNHWWNVTLYLDARGLTTRRMPYAEGDFEVLFDLVAHELVVRTSRGDVQSFALEDGLSVAGFYERFVELLAGLGIDVEIEAEPYGVPMTTPFAEDTEHASYDRAAVERYFVALSWVDRTLQEFSGWFCGKTTQVHLFWHGFDLALTRFSGRRAPTSPDADRVTREAYSHEVISVGFWPGDQNVREPAFYAYTAPEPPGLANEPLLPATATWRPTGAGHLAHLPYDDVRASADPRQTLLDFLQSAYLAGATTANWDEEDLRSNWCPAGTVFDRPGP